jgi:hypothetical protein
MTSGFAITASCRRKRLPMIRSPVFGVSAKAASHLPEHLPNSEVHSEFKHRRSSSPD